MQLILGGGEGGRASCEHFVNPDFLQLAALPESDDAAFEGLMTFGNRRDAGGSLLGRVYRRADEILVVCEYDVTRVGPLEQRVGRHVP